MKIENPLKFLLKQNTLEPGDRMVLKFKLPEIVSEVYGNIDDLCGEIPLMHKYSECPVSPFYDLSEREQEVFIRKYYDYAKTIRGEFDDESLRNYIISMIICTICYAQHLKPDTPEFDFNVKFIMISLKTDDAVDSEDFYDEDFNYSKALETITTGMVEAKRGNLEPMLRAKKLYPPLEPFFDIFFKKYGQSNINGHEDSNGEVDLKRYWEFHELLNLMSSQVILFSGTFLKNMSKYNKMLIGGINKGVVLLCEWHMSDLGITVDRSIREHFLFKQMLDCFNILTACKNDIRGLVKDIRNKEIISNSILSCINPEEGRDFHYCFNETLSHVKENSEMFLSYANLLLISFPRDLGLRDYIDFLKTALDGELLMYFGFSYMELRYGSGGEFYIDKY